MPIDPSLLDDDLKILRKKYGQDAVHKGSEQPDIRRLELRSPALNRITGGGIPYGRITRLWSQPSAGKSHVGWEIVRAAQEAKLQVVYWNIEKQFDEVHCRAHLGIDTDALKIGEVSTIEDFTEQMELLMRSTHVHIVDSCSQATSREELAADVGDWQRALDARVWKKSIKRISARMDKQEHIIVLISHAGQDMQTKSEYAKDGGEIEFASSMSLHFRKGSWLYHHPEGHLEKPDKIKEDIGVSPSGMKEADGFEVTVRCMKSRVCRPFRVAKMRLDLHTFQFDTAFELLDAATFFDLEGEPAHRSKRPAIAQKTGERSSWYLLPDGTKVQGDPGIRARLMEDQELSAAVRKAMLGGW